jgi:putative ABC transport system permease protein
MIRGYIQIAFRNFIKNGLSSVIVLFGLSIGLTSCLFIGMYIRNELNYDRFQVNGDHIFRVIMDYSFNGSPESKKGNFTSMKVAPVLKRNFPQVQEAVRMDKYPTVVRYQDKLLNEKNFYYADSSFFSVFSFPLLRGNPLTALNAPNQIVITETTAKRYFGREDPMGKLVNLDTDDKPYRITGVVPDCPLNSQIKFDFLGSFISYNMKHELSTYWDANYTTYLLLRDPKSVNQLEVQVNDFMRKEMAGEGASIKYSFESFRNIHLHSEYGGFEPNINIKYIYILEGISVLLLIIASFTYINLNTARSVERAKEVGVRKVIGAGRSQLFWQFMGESFIINLLAVGISFAIALLFLPYFNQLTGREFNSGDLFSFQVISGMLILSMLVSLLAGSYPAILLTKIIPVQVLKGSFKSTSKGHRIRQFLVIFQFSISVLLIASTVIMQKQIKYVQNRDLGYNREQVLVLPFDYQMNDLLPVVKQTFLAHPNITSISRCVNTPVNIKNGYSMRSALMPEGEEISVAGNPIDESFIKTVGLHLIAGQDLSQRDMKDADALNDSEKVFHFILNESAAKQLGWTPVEAVGKKMFLGNHRPGFVKGVVKDFNFESMHQRIKPVVLFPEARGKSLLVKLGNSNIPETISFIKSKWKTLISHRPFEYHFLDEDFNMLYESEIRLGIVLNIFSGMAITLALLGLFGLSSYSAKQRQKEISIRKVLGAGINQIIYLLTLNFVKLILIAILIASPLAWIFMNWWLREFAYHVSIQWWIFIVTGFTVIIIAFIAVSLHVVRAAISNPIKSLRTE